MTDNHNHIRVLASADWTRRNFLRLAAFAGGVAALSVNGVAIAADKGDLAEKARKLKGDAALGDTLFIYSWADYANPDVLDAFRRAPVRALKSPPSIPSKRPSPSWKSQAAPPATTSSSWAMPMWNR